MAISMAQQMAIGAACDVTSRNCFVVLCVEPMGKLLKNAAKRGAIWGRW